MWPKNDAIVLGILVSLRCLFDNMKFDHVIFFPSTHSEKITDIDHLALQDSFILHRMVLMTALTPNKTIRKTEGRTKVIQSQEDLKETLLQRSNDVVSILCDDPSDLQVFEEKLRDLLSEDQTQIVVYCPFAPFDHPYNIIDDFFDKVEEGWTGRT